MLMDRYVAFDLEIAKEIPETAKDWMDARPLGISCAATLDSEGNLVLWHSSMFMGLDEDEPYAPQMSVPYCRFLTCYLLGMRSLGFRVLTWNGLGFDFNILAEECADLQCERHLIDLALDHTDLAFAMFCEKGFMIGLDLAAKGMGLLGKIEGMHGSLAPQLWKQGRKAQEEVLRYVAQDVRTTAELCQCIEERKNLRWVSPSSRRPSHWRLSGDRIPTVREALNLPAPDTSWMSNPWPRSKFYSWTETKESIPNSTSEGGFENG